jgi:hypothetical protein
LWPRLCVNAAPNTGHVNNIVAAGMLLRKSVAEASRCAVILCADAGSAGGAAVRRRWLRRRL